MIAVKRFTRAELEEIARRQYAYEFRAPERVEVRNVDAVLSLWRPRVLVWRGVAYRVPPLSFEAGARLTILRLGLEQAPHAKRHAYAAARALFRTLVEPARWWRRLVWHATPNPFRSATPAEIRELLDWFLEVPDEGPRVPSGDRVIVDLADGLATFAAAFPGWMRDGRPLSWPIYVHGLRYIARARARESIHLAQAVRVAQGARVEEWQRWLSELRSVAGW